MRLLCLPYLAYHQNCDVHLAVFSLSVYIQNHDQARAVSRFGNDSPAWRATSAKMLAMLEIAQTGTLYVYEGEEIGMANGPRSWPIEEYKDIATQNYYQK